MSKGHSDYRPYIMLTKEQCQCAEKGTSTMIVIEEDEQRISISISLNQINETLKQ